MSDLSYLDSVLLGVVEGITEYLPISSTGHLTIAEKLLGLSIDNPAVTSYTAVIQMGAIAATLLYFWKKIWAMLRGFVAGLGSAEARQTESFQLALAVIVGSLPVVVVALLMKDVIKGPLRSLYVVAAALILWSFVMWFAERLHTRWLAADRVRFGDKQVTLRDGFFMGVVQCCSLVPGVSRSGATMSAGLARGLDRVTATELSFYMAIPALTGAGLFELKDVDTSVVGAGQLVVGTLVSFVVAYVSIAWLLRFVRSNSLLAFIVYRIAAGFILLGCLTSGYLSAR